MPLSSFWNGDGQHHLLVGFPSSFEHWSVGDEVDEHRRALLDRIEVALSSKIVSTDVRADSDRSLVLEVELEDGRREIIRALVQGHDSEMFESEVALLAWLSRRTLVPVPRLHCVVPRSMTEPDTFAIMQKLPGDCLMNVFGGLSYPDKESIVREIAKIMLRLNDVSVPQRIGTTLIRNDEITLIPPQRITPLPADIARVFETLEDYMHALIEARRASDMIGTDDADRARAQVALARLASELPPILARLSSPVYRRCVLRHDDLRDTNVLLDGSRISGVVDWEYHSTIPVVLAAQPPCWIRYDGIYDPRFTDTALETWWLASPEDASRLRAVYSETVKALNEDYWRVMAEGELLQQIEEWLTEHRPDPGCDRMSAWMDTRRARP
ncbi:hypothetical protein OH76DRAFT_1481564 [Lentinus brumalis]|uniref:Aminoglycoside phosphotransferase domain-containing protein n=1 Tax=Lentinus brumalis TaxID=2498619 RepID=A0A371DFI2_9APHY|nr:hypothetical protein OH76DRAFT_1481564 [Polyporus brumalis]